MSESEDFRPGRFFEEFHELCNKHKCRLRADAKQTKIPSYFSPGFYDFQIIPGTERNMIRSQSGRHGFWFSFEEDEAK